MFGIGILSGLLILPLVGVAALLLLRGEDEATRNNARWIALWTTLATFVLSLFAWADFNTALAGFQLVEQRSWFSQAITYKLGVDGLSMPFVLLTTFLMPLCIAASWLSIQKRVTVIGSKVGTGTLAGSAGRRDGGGPAGAAGATGKGEPSGCRP